MVVSTRRTSHRRQGRHGFPLAVLLLAAAYLLPGLSGRDPWKPDEPYVFGMVLNILDGGDWVVPAVAGEPFLEKPPLYPIVAALAARTTAAVLPLRDGARLANLLFNAVTLAAVAAAARRTWGPGRGWIGSLILLGCAGFIIDARMMLPDIALLAGFALGFTGLLGAPAGGWKSALLLGTGTGIAFLAKGLVGPGILGVSALCALAMPGFRNRRYVAALARALAVALPWLTVWPAALYARSPALFGEWFWQNNIGRFAGFSVATLGAAHSDWFWSVTLPWFAFPAWPLAAGYLYAERARPWPMEVKLSLVVLSVTLAVLTISASAREIYALPLLAPVSVLAVGGALRIRPSLDRALAGTITLSFGTLAILILCAWAAFRLNPGLVPSLPAALPNHVTAERNTVALALFGILVSVAASAGAWMKPSSVIPQAVVAWVAGIALCLQVLFGLWTPWLDEAKSYRIPFEAMSTALPLESGECLATRGVGESERAMLHYIAHVRPVPTEGGRSGRCNFVLVQDRDQSSTLDPGPSWQVAWQGARPADSHECFTLYTHATVAASVSADAMTGEQGEDVVERAIWKAMGGTGKRGACTVTSSAGIRAATLSFTSWSHSNGQGDGNWEQAWDWQE